MHAPLAGILVCTLVVVGCAQNARPASMAVTPVRPMAGRTPPPNSRRIAIVDVTGGGGLGWMGRPNVPNDALRSALEQSLIGLGYLADDSANAGVDLRVQLVRLERPWAPSKVMEVTSVVRYAAVERGTRSTIFDSTFQTTARATSTDAAAGTTRLRIANEIAIRANIACFLAGWQSRILGRTSGDSASVALCHESR